MNKLQMTGEIVEIFEIKQVNNFTIGGFLLKETSNYKGEITEKLYPFTLFNEKAINFTGSVGDFIYAEGKINSRPYTNTKTGEKSYSVNLVGDIINILKKTDEEPKKTNVEESEISF
jgi:hypothetical protein